MARYTGPRVRISRRFGIPIFGASKYLERKNGLYQQGWIPAVRNIPRRNSVGYRFNQG